MELVVSSRLPRGPRCRERRMTTRRNDEERLQRAVVQLLMLAYPDLRWRAIPNGEYRSPRTAGRLKAMGVQAGVADLHITLPRGRTAWIELKSAKGVQSD